jgi:hypothetical protein
MRTIDEHIAEVKRADAGSAGCHGRELCEASEAHRKRMIDELAGLERVADAIAPYRHTPEDRELWEHEDGTLNIDALVREVRELRGLAAAGSPPQPLRQEAYRCPKCSMYQGIGACPHCGLCAPMSHVCGLSGFGEPGDRCCACDWLAANRWRHSVEAAGSPPQQQADGKESATNVPFDSERKVGCMDCVAVYADFPLDTTLPDEQWRMIHDRDGGLLCASCIVKRGAKLPGVIALRARFEFAGEAGSPPSPPESETT